MSSIPAGDMQASQQLRLSSVIGRSALIFRIRNAKELEALSEENSAVVGRDQFKAIYDAATAEPYSFLYIDTTAKSVDTMFYLRFEQPIALTIVEK